MHRRQALIAALSVVGLGAAGCGSRHGPGPVVPTPAPPLYPSRAADLFRPGTRHLLATGETAVSEIVPGGVLRLPTGRLTAADPGWVTRRWPDGVGPFTVTVPPGAYPLTLALLDGRVAAARLTLADRPVTSWDLALRAGEDPATLAPGYFFGVGVDTGTMALFDEAAHDAVGRLADTDPLNFDVEDSDTLEHRDVVPGANVIAFLTGFGDGEYPVWIGRTRDGIVGCFVVDMQMLAPATTTTAPPWLPPPSSGRRRPAPVDQPGSG
ncbi:DUF4241 domain-containing protein [Micromonospora sp. NPDC004551]|uniref:DUF4241 domain-containing protein n=1 Tax=Micromonospora sp. NPDC004551 TaxID=3154284 RepID=UPI0033B91F76